MKHADLIARLEKLTGPDREMDGDIAVALRDAPLGSVRMWAMSEGGARFATGAYTHWEAPRYTASLDAAVALGERLLPGQVWHLMTAALKDWSISDGKTSDLPRFYVLALLRALQESDPAAKDEA